jgi:hypothetical protein
MKGERVVKGKTKNMIQYIVYEPLNILMFTVFRPVAHDFQLQCFALALLHHSSLRSTMSTYANEEEKLPLSMNLMQSYSNNILIQRYVAQKM